MSLKENHYKEISNHLLNKKNVLIGCDNEDQVIDKIIEYVGDTEITREQLLVMRFKPSARYLTLLIEEGNIDYVYLDNADEVDLSVLEDVEKETGVKVVY